MASSNASDRIMARLPLRFQRLQVRSLWGVWTSNTHSLPASADLHAYHPPPRHTHTHQGSIIKQIAARATPSSISLAGGIPHESTFCFQSVEVKKKGRWR